MLSLQGKTPLPGHPKTLRDLTNATELLTLPSSFGAIQLGETFSSCLCVNNEASVDIDGVSLKVEMQTVTSKVLLSDFGGQDCRLAVGATLENVVNHEIKELGQHVLACLVTYRLPPNARNTTTPTNSVADPNIQSYRKFYKFIVSSGVVHNYSGDNNIVFRSPTPSLSKRKFICLGPLPQYCPLQKNGKSSWKSTFKI